MSSPTTLTPPTVTTPPAQYDWILDVFISETPGVQHAVLTTADGLKLAAGATTSDDYADRLSAAGVGLYAVAANTAPRHIGKVRQVLVEVDEFVIFTAGGRDHKNELVRLIVVAGWNADADLIGHEMAELLKSFASHTGTSPRHAAVAA